MQLDDSDESYEEEAALIFLKRYFLLKKILSVPVRNIVGCSKDIIFVLFWL